MASSDDVHDIVQSSSYHTQRSEMVSWVGESAPTGSGEGGRRVRNSRVFMDIHSLSEGLESYDYGAYNVIMLCGFCESVVSALLMRWVCTAKI